jgi:hypothetical protein
LVAPGAVRELEPDGAEAREFVRREDVDRADVRDAAGDAVDGVAEREGEDERWGLDF